MRVAPPLCHSYMVSIWGAARRPRRRAASRPTGIFSPLLCILYLLFWPARAAECAARALHNGAHITCIHALTAMVRRSAQAGATIHFWALIIITHLFYAFGRAVCITTPALAYAAHHTASWMRFASILLLTTAPAAQRGFLFGLSCIELF